jgi:hypothetical protein
MDGRQGGMLDNYPLRSPFGKPGDALWIRETFAEGVVGCPGGLSYRADHLDPKGDGPANPMKWSPSIHMPRAASRITLTVKRVWVERVQDITEEGVVAEGVRVPHTLGESLMPDAMRERAWASARAEARRRFARRWDSVHAGKGLGWDTNPWVWACEFEVSE